jgi:Fic family protein
VSIDFAIPLTQEILSKISSIDHFRGEWSTGNALSQKRLDSLYEAAKIQAIASSCRLTGIHVTDHDVAGIIRNDAVAQPEAPAVLGYSAAMDYPLPENGTLLKTDDLRKLNGVLLGKREEAEKGSDWRKEPLHREAFDSNGQILGWVFPTLPPHLVEEKTEDLVTWLEFELLNGEQHPVLVIAAFILAFLAISPFERGNGRTGRLLIGHLLRRAGYSYMPYASVESLIEKHREGYLESLMQSRARLWSDEADLEPWVAFFLDILDSHREGLEARLDLERRSMKFSPLQREIMEAVREHGSVDAALLIEATGANRNTLKDNLRRMVDRGLLEKTGQRRGTRYRLAAFEPAALTNEE